MRSRFLISIVALLLIAPTYANANMFALGIGGSAVEYRNELLSEGLTCSSIDGAKFTCKNADRSFKIEVVRIVSKMSNRGKVLALHAVSFNTASRSLLIQVSQHFPPTLDQNVQFDSKSWVIDGCAKSGTKTFPQERWGVVQDITREGNACRLDITDQFR